MEHPARLLKDHLLFGVVSLGLFLLGVGVLASLVVSRNDWKNVQVIEDSSLEKDTPLSPITIDVAGAVEHPGVFHLPADSRVQDALAAAGGLSASADRNWISRNINMAQKITDGNKIFIPGVGQSDVGRQTSDNRKIESISESSISINSSTAGELETLWGVGQARSQAIISGRPYGTIDELITKKILPKSVVEKNMGRISL